MAAGVWSTWKPTNDCKVSAGTDTIDGLGATELGLLVSVLNVDAGVKAEEVKTNCCPLLEQVTTLLAGLLLTITTPLIDGLRLSLLGLLLLLLSFGLLLLVLLSLIEIICCCLNGNVVGNCCCCPLLPNCCCCCWITVAIGNVAGNSCCWLVTHEALKFLLIKYIERIFLQISISCLDSKWLIVNILYSNSFDFLPG